VFSVETTERDYFKILGTLKQVQRDAYRDIINGALTVLITLAFSIALIYILTLVHGGTNSGLISVVEVLISLLVFYVSISRLALMFWNSWRITVYPRLPLEHLNNKSHNARLYELLKREDKVVRKVANLIALSITLIYLQFSGKISVLTSLIEVPRIFASEPVLIFLPLHVIVLFSIAHDIPVLAVLREKIRNELDEVKILVERSRCPICENVIPKKSIHCPYCGARIEEKGGADEE